MFVLVENGHQFWVRAIQNLISFYVHNSNSSIQCDKCGYHAYVVHLRLESSSCSSKFQKVQLD